MSVRVMSWVFEHSRATGNDRLVLLAIADRCDDDGGNCWKSTTALAAKAMVSKRTAQRCIDSLVALGELSVVERPGTTNMLAVLMEGRQSVTPPTVEDAAESEGGVNLTPVTVVTPRQPDTGDTRVQGGVTTVSTDTSLNHPRTPQPPASGGQGHCSKHSKNRKGCRNCEAAAVAEEAEQQRRRTEERQALADCDRCDPDGWALDKDGYPTALKCRDHRRTA